MPLQFDRAYFSLGWLVQGILFIGYGIKVRNRKLEFAGELIFALCLSAFYLDFSYKLYDLEIFEEVKYACMIAGMIGVLIIYLYKNKEAITQRTLENEGLILYKYFSLASVWIYLIRIAFKVIRMNEDLAINYLPLKALFLSLITAILMSLIKRVKWLYDKYSRNLVIVGFGAIDVIGILYNVIPYVMTPAEMGWSLRAVGIVVMLLWNGFVLINLSSLVKEVIVKQKYSVEIYPLVLAIVLMTNMTMILGIQLSLGIGSVIISIFYVVSAFAMIGIGFKFGYRKLRYLGLVLCLFALGKLFLFDFSIGVAVGYRSFLIFALGWHYLLFLIFIRNSASI